MAKRTDRRTCLVCGTRIGSGRRADAKFCSERCRVRGHRTLAALAKQAVATLRPELPPAPGEVMHPGLHASERVKFTRTYHPTIARMVGDAVLRAAARRNPGCRWHYALLDARVHQDRTPVYDSVHRELLGEPCDRCKTALRTAQDQRNDALAALVASVNAGRPSPGRHPNQLAPGRVASGPTSHDPFGTCGVCTAWRERHPESGVTASGLATGLVGHPWFASVSQFEEWIRAGRPKRGR